MQKIGGFYFRFQKSKGQFLANYFFQDTSMEIRKNSFGAFLKMLIVSKFWVDRNAKKERKKIHTEEDN